MLISSDDRNLIFDAIEAIENKKLLTVSGYDNIPTLPGVYAIYKNQEMVYIGQSKAIQRRVKSKCHPYYNDDVRVAWILVRDKKLRLALESALIFCFEPEGNTVMPVDFYADDRIDQLIIGIKRKQSFGGTGAVKQA